MPDPNLEHARRIGEKLRAVRHRKHISLRELARQTDISASMISQIETGKAYPSVRSIYSIAEALDVRVDYFFPEPDHSASQPNDFRGEASPDLTASEMRETRLEEIREYAYSPDNTKNRPTVTVVHVDARPTIELNSGVRWARLTKDAELDSEFLEVTYECGATSGTTMSRHAGREFGLILSGELTIQLGFETHQLSEGDSIIFDSATPHRLSNEGSVPMRALWIVMNRV